MASARVWLRSLPIHDYIAALAPYAEAMPDASNIQVEVAAVRANQTEWTEKGDALLLDRARRDYVTELGSFRAWQRDNPDKKDWRTRPPTRTQLFLISRNAARLGIDEPFNLDRGGAHDWIEAHGGNLRLAEDGVTADVADAQVTTSGKASVDITALAAALTSVTGSEVSATVTATRRRQGRDRYPRSATDDHPARSAKQIRDVRQLGGTG